MRRTRTCAWPRGSRSAPWSAIIALALLLLPSCQLHQEFRFNADGSGVASATLGIDKDVCTPPRECEERARWLLSGDGPVANARSEVDDLPFAVRIGPAQGLMSHETGYALAFDFESIGDLQQKLARDAMTGESLVSPNRFSELQFRDNGTGGFNFTAEIMPRRLVSGGWEDSETFAVVVPGEPAEHNADVVEQVPGGTRFQWNFGPGVEVTYLEAPHEPGYVLLKASTCSKCPSRRYLLGVVLGLVAVLILGAVAALLLLGRSRRTGPRPPVPETGMRLS